MLRREPLVIGNDCKTDTRVAWCTGGAQDYFDEAIGLGVDAFITEKFPNERFMPPGNPALRLSPPAITRRNVMVYRLWENIYRRNSESLISSLISTARYERGGRSEFSYSRKKPRFPSSSRTILSFSSVLLNRLRERSPLVPLILTPHIKWRVPNVRYRTESLSSRVYYSNGVAAI